MGKRKERLSGELVERKVKKRILVGEIFLPIKNIEFVSLPRDSQ